MSLSPQLPHDVVGRGKKPTKTPSDRQPSFWLCDEVTCSNSNNAGEEATPQLLNHAHAHIYFSIFLMMLFRGIAFHLGGNNRQFSGSRQSQLRPAI